MPFNIEDHLSLNKPIATSGKPELARYLYYDTNFFSYRPFRSKQEVIDYYPVTKSRLFLQSVLINTGGVLSNGEITGGVNEEYWWKDNYTDEGLVLKSNEEKIINIPEKVFNEIPSGIINGINTEFTSLNTFIPESLVLIVNGLIMKPFDDYINVGNQLIRLSFSMQIGESILINYIKL